MDYSQVSHDPEHPAGPSPWVTSPPTTSRTSFGASTLQSEESSPVATTSSSPYTERQSRRSDTGSDDETLINDNNNGFAGPQQTDRSMLHPRNGDESPDLSTRLQSPTFAEQQYLNQQHQQQQYQQQYMGQQQQQQRQASYQQQQKPIPSRYQTGARTGGPRPNAPQYKLIAKITGLERTGRKDPILRFDIHVMKPTNPSHPIPHTSATANKPSPPKPDQPPQIPHDPIPRRTPHAFRIQQAGRPPHLLEPGSLRARGTAAAHRRGRGHGRRRSARQGVAAALAQLRLRQRRAHARRGDDVFCRERLWI